jgi:hypothetical protein
MYQLASLMYISVCLLDTTKVATLIVFQSCYFFFACILERSLAISIKQENPCCEQVSMEQTHKLTTPIKGAKD